MFTAVSTPSLTRTSRKTTGVTDRTSETKKALVFLSALLLMTGTWLSGFGPVSPIAVMVGALGLAVLGPREALAGTIRAWPLWLIIVLPIASSLWSTDPGISLRYGTQLSITVICGIVLASTLDAPAFLRVVFASSSLILLICFSANRYDNSPEGQVWIGILGSKNQMGQLCQLVICSALAVAVSTNELLLIRVASLAMALIATTVMAVTFSAGAILTTIVFLIAAGLFKIGSRLSSGAKVLLAAVVGFFVLPLWLIRNDLSKAYVDFLVNVLHKDPGLTGRDYLWEHADRMIAMRPIVGWGYRSTWMGSSAETIGLLRWAHLSSGAGFNFHDTLREWSVDFGLLGAAVVVFCLMAGMARVMMRNLTSRATTAGIFMAASVVVVLTRAKVELVFGPFVCSTVFIVAIATAGYLQTRATADDRSKASGAGARMVPSVRPVTPARRRQVIQRETVERPER